MNIPVGFPQDVSSLSPKMTKNAIGRVGYYAVQTAFNLNSAQVYVDQITMHTIDNYPVSDQHFLPLTS